jgi:signal transduction histidine kinase
MSMRTPGHEGLRTPDRRPPFPVPDDPGKRSAVSFAAAAVIALAGIYAGVAFAGDSLPDSIESAFGPNVIRWVLVGAAAVAAISLLWVESRRQKATEAYVEELHLAAELVRRAEDASALTEANRGLNRASPENLMEAVARGAMVTVGAAHASVYLWDEDNNVMVPIGWTMHAAPEERPVDDHTGRAWTTQQPVLTNDPPPSTVSAPIVVAGEVAGVVTASAEGKRFGDRELRILASYAADAAVAITRARALERERQVAERLADIDRAKNDFVAAITHELKTPLTSLLGYASILRKRVDALPKDRREQFFEIIQRQGERILKLIGELLESSRMESGLAKLRREHIDLHLIVNTVVAGMKPVARRHTVQVDLPAEDPGLYGDPSALEHVLTNLLDNALKYSPKKTTVRIWFDVEPSEIRLNVSDQGSGIPPEELPHIFERWRQGTDIERQRSSVGLGLFIVRSLVEAQGGRVSATSVVGRGSTFTVSFPRRSSGRDAELPELSGEPGAPETEIEPAPPEIAIGESAKDEGPTASIDAETLRAVAASHQHTPRPSDA